MSITYTTLDQRSLIVSDSVPLNEFYESGTLWLNTTTGKLLRYSDSAWIESHNHGDYYALKSHIHEMNEINGLNEELKKMNDVINTMDGSSALYIGYFNNYEDMTNHESNFIDNSWCTVAKDETKNNIKSKYMYTTKDGFIWAGEVADDNLLIDDNSNTTNLCWSSRKLTQEFAKRPMVIIQDSEPTEISIGQIWISENPS